MGAQHQQQAMIIRSPPVSAFRSNGLSTVCLSCLLSTAKPARRAVTRQFSQKSNVKAALAAAGTTTRLRAEYFFGNGSIEYEERSTDCLYIGIEFNCCRK